MNERLRGMKGEHVRAVGTQSLRQARNLNEFLLEAQDALGFPIEAISGREEARLVFKRRMNTPPPSSEACWLVTSVARRLKSLSGKASKQGTLSHSASAASIRSLRFFKDGRIDRSSLKKRKSRPRPSSKKRCPYSRVSTGMRRSGRAGR